MHNNKIVAVIVPAYNEGKLISKTLTTMPDFVDHVVVVEDGGTDDTYDQIIGLAKNEPRIHVIKHEKNQGLGQTLIDGYLYCREKKYDIVAIMAGDAQMDPDDLDNVVSPISKDIVHYVKGNRFFMDQVIDSMPTYRLIGNAGLTILTKFATGYWHIIDPQCGYTAISKEALRVIPIQKMTRRYGYNADILNMLNIRNFRVADVDVKPIYGDETSKIKLHTYIPKISCLLVRLFFRRLVMKYLMRNFNPLSISYFLSFFMFFLGALPFAIRILYMYATTSEFPRTSFLCFIFFMISSIQLFLFAVQFDMEDNRSLMFHYDSRNTK